MTKSSLLTLATLAALAAAPAARAQNYAGMYSQSCSQCGESQGCSQCGGSQGCSESRKTQGCTPGPCGSCFCPCAIDQTKNHDSVYMNQIWPRQYMAPSRRGICEAFTTVTANGWRRNNLLTKFDFDPKGEGLSEAGKLKVEWILTQAPPQRRTIFVQRGADTAETSQRVEAVQSLAANLSVGSPNIQETILQDYGRPAASVDAVFTGFSANQPPPMLPQASAANSSSSGSGS